MSLKNLALLEDYIPKENLRQLQAAIEKDQAVQRHVEQLPPYDAAMYILQEGCTSHKVSMLQRLHITLRDCDERKTSQLLSELTQAMWTQELELQVAAPEAIVTVLPRLSEGQVVALLGGTKNMLCVKNEEARQAWSKLALEVVPYLPVKTLTDDMIPLVLKKVQHSEPVDQRTLGCRLIGRICRRLARAGSADTIAASGLLQRALGLCQDTERYMRCEMCGQLIEIARAIGPQMTKQKITSELFQLVADEEPPVAKAALSAVVLDFVDFYDAGYRKEHVWPVLRSYIASPQDEFVSLLAEVFGKFLCKVKGDLASSPEDVTLLANFFKAISQKPDPELRRWCAFNFPAVVTVFPHAVFTSTLSPVLKALASDPHVATRRSVAAGLHELIALLGDRAAAPLKEPVLLLVQDAALEVRHIIFRKLGPLLELFSAQLRSDERDAFFSAVVPHIVSYESAVHRDWRASLTLLESFPHFTRYFPGSVLSQKFVNPLLQHLHSGASAVKDLCCPILISFTRALTNNGAIAERYARIVNEFGRSVNCHHRRTFVQLFAASVPLFSRKFIRVRMVEVLLDLARDAVPNVRMQLARVMPIVRRVLKAPVDADLAAAFQQAWGRLADDTDPIVRETAEHVAPILADLERDFSRQAAMRVTVAEDVQDKRREDAEGDLVELTREMEKNERRLRLREMLMKEQAECGLPVDGGLIGVGVGGATTSSAVGGVGVGVGVGGSAASGGTGSHSSSPFGSLSADGIERLGGTGGAFSDADLYPTSTATTSSTGALSSSIKNSSITSSNIGMGVGGSSRIRGASKMGDDRKMGGLSSGSTGVQSSGYGQSSVSGGGGGGGGGGGLGGRKIGGSTSSSSAPSPIGTGGGGGGGGGAIGSSSTGGSGGGRMGRPLGSTASAAAGGGAASGAPSMSVPRTGSTTRATGAGAGGGSGSGAGGSGTSTSTATTYLPPINRNVPAASSTTTGKRPLGTRRA